ncbi:MAG TPA: hypothetical protein VLK82_05150 [Candidatus Tectomicrobia bacterium]|nr:hypothetical protein [Candidatus Tectomicrobia bacterium]
MASQASKLNGCAGPSKFSASNASRPDPAQLAALERAMDRLLIGPETART